MEFTPSDHHGRNDGAQVTSLEMKKYKPSVTGEQTLLLRQNLLLKSYFRLMKPHGESLRGVINRKQARSLSQGGLIKTALTFRWVGSEKERAIAGASVARPPGACRLRSVAQYDHQPARA